MTRKPINYRENGAKIIFKKSVNTLHTYSKTFSGASQIYTKSLLLQLKQNLPKDNYYEENGTIKRDLSIETDICILRRYCKKKRNLINRETVSAKSKYSINRTEIDTIDEFKPDTSACGDSEQNVHLDNTFFNINLTSLVIENLKDLLSNWIKTYLLEKKETKQKVDAVLDSLLHKLDLKGNDSSSSCTYTVNVEVLNRNPNQTESQASSLKNLALKTSKLAEKASTLSIPLSGKYLRIISTLSLPRNIQKTKRHKNSRHDMKKIRHKKILLSISKSSNYIYKSSNLDFLTLPTKSLTKNCVTYEHEKNKEAQANYVMPNLLPNNKNIINDYMSNNSIYIQNILDVEPNRRCSNSKRILNFNKNVNSNTNQKMNSKTNRELEERQGSLNDKNETKKCKSSNEQDQSDPLITIDLVKQSFKCHKDRLNHHKPKAKNKTNCYSVKYKRNNICKKNLSKFRNYKNIKTKQFTYLFRKSNNLINQEKTLLKHFQSVFEYFSNWDGKKGIKVDIQVNVFPIQENKKHDFINLDKENCSTTAVTPDVNSDNLKLEIENAIQQKETSNDKQNIISLLDGAASQVKYIISRETSTETFETNSKMYNNQTIQNLKQSNIAQEIGELKIIIKSLTTATEKLANDHIFKQHQLKDNITKTVNENVTNLIKSSKSIQFSNITPKSEIISGIKIKKEPRNKNTRNFNSRLMKTSASYKIIDSESILKVTDMTSAAQDIITDTVMDKALTCSIPKSKSVFEMRKKPDEEKLLAFYIDDVVKPNENVYNVCNHKIPYCCIPYRDGCQHLKPFCIYSRCNQNKCCDNETCTGDPNFECTEYTPTNDDCELYDNCNSSICIDIDSKSFDKKITIRNRIGMGFWEGCLYCLLLWIPILLISWLFYIHVVKDLLKPKHSLLRTLSSSEQHKTNESYNPMSLTDLGF